MRGEWTPCELCGMTAVHRHHCFFGTANRKVSERLGMVVDLCMSCHALVHADYTVRVKLCRKYQAKYEETHTREEFRAEFGRSYL